MNRLCVFCRTYVGPDHHHTAWQVILWLWDGRAAWKPILITAAVTLTISLAIVLKFITDLVRGNL